MNETRRSQLWAAAKERAKRTLQQGFVVDAALAGGYLVYELLGNDHADWSDFLPLLGKTMAMAALAHVLRLKKPPATERTVP